jgi:hypothetical protein
MSQRERAVSDALGAGAGNFRVKWPGTAAA